MEGLLCGEVEGGDVGFFWSLGRLELLLDYWKKRGDGEME